MHLPSPDTTRRGRLRALVLAGALAAATLPALALTTAPSAHAAGGTASPWTRAEGQQRLSGNPKALHPSAYAAYTLDHDAMVADLSRAHGEGRRAVPSTITLPDPAGTLLTFTVTESSLYQAGLAAEYPDFKQYIGTTASGAESLALDVSPYGLHASVRGDGESFLVDPADIPDGTTPTRYLSYRASDLPEPEQPLVEPELDEKTIDTIKQKVVKQGQRFGEAPGAQVNLRTYRLALLTDPTYAEYVAPGSNAGTITDTESNRMVLAAKTVLMDRVNQIYTNDLAVKMIMVDDTDKLNLNTNAKAYNANGPCGSAACFTTTQISNGCGSALLTRNRYVVGQLIGASKFDIGHIGLGINGGGIASLGVVGGASKAQGCTGLPDPIGDFYAIDYVAHEMGHEFSGNHTFNGTQVNCSTSNRTGTTGVEPGSGSSVMAYAGICLSDDLQPHTDPYFSQRSQTEISNYLGSTLANANEVQEFGLTNFTTNGNSFTLTFPSFTNAAGATVTGGTTVPIVRGGTASATQQPYTAAGIKAAVEAITGATVTATGMFATGTPGDTGFTLTYTTGLAGVDVPTPTLAAVSETTGSPIGVISNDIVKGGAGTNNGVLTPIANHAPEVTAPVGKFIPTRTPFTLTGSGADADGDDLVYLWEQNDNGASGTTTGVGLIQQPKANGPLFRVFGHAADVTDEGTLQSPSPGENIADSNPSRTFPDMDQILAGATNQATGSCPTPVATDFVNDTPTRDLTSSGFGVVPNTLKDGPELECFSEFLPTSAYVGTAAASNVEPSLNFRLTARDQDPFGGGYQFADTKLRLDRNAGPLYVTGLGTAGQTISGGATQTLTWDVNNTDKPSLAPNVKISLSTDGGQTFDTVLAESTPNDGSADVVIPNVKAAAARIKVEAVGNYFFDVNHADFAIAPTFGVDTTVTNQTNVVAYSDTVDAPVVVTSATGDSSTITGTATGLPPGIALTQTSASAAGVVPGTATYEFTGASTVADGDYPTTLTFGDGVNSDVLEVLFRAVPEDATAVYTGPTALEAPAGSPTTVPLSATVTQDDDGTPGDLTLATATFTDTATGAELCTTAVAADGTASCDYTADVPDGGFSLDVAVTVGGSFAGSTPADTTVTVGGVDVTAPNTVVTSGPADGAIVTSDVVSFGFAVSEAGETFVCTLDGAPLNCGNGSVRIGGLAQRTHVVTIAAVDAAGNVDETPVSRTFTVPVNDTRLKTATSGWTRKAKSVSYMTTYTVAKKAHSALTYQVNDATSLSLLVSQKAGYGAVRVFIGDTLLKTIDTNVSPAKSKKVYVVRNFAVPHSGTVTIKTATDKTVQIEGLAVVTNPVS